jgi:cytochrome P450
MIPRATTDSDVHYAYYIPVHTTIFVNTFTIHKSPTYFPFPEEFAPQRFLPEGHRLWEERLKGEVFPGKYKQGVFGWERRSCPGADLAGNGVSVLLMKVVWGFDLSREGGGGEGELALEKVGYEGGIIHRPKQFKCIFQVRGEEYERVMEREMVEAERVLEGCEAWE